MKKNLLNFILLIVISAFTLQSQTNVNREWQENSGTPVINPLVNPAGLDWYSSITNSLGQIITTGHTNVSGQGENLYLKKLSATGAVIFTVTFNSSGTNNDYGIALTQDASNNIYVVGTTDNGGTTNYNVLLLKYNASGVLQFSVTYAGPAGLNDIGTSVKRDASGNIFVACSSEGTSTSYDYRLNKYSPTGTLLWSSTYNFVSLIDVPLGLTINGNIVSVNGTSASSAIKWDYCNANFNATTGTFQSATRTNIPGVGFDQPYAFVKDASQNIYLTGRNSTTGTNYNIFTVKISPTYSLMWTQFYDLAGQDDLGSDIDVDASGNIIVGGFTTKSNGVKQATLLKYNPSGTLLWQYHQAGKKETADASITGLCVNSNSDAYFVAGETGTSNLQEVLVGKITSAGYIVWERSIASPQNNVPAKINLNTDGTILVTSLRKGSPDTYQTTKYSEFALNNNVTYNGTKAVAKQNELIIRFKRTAINTSAVNNQIGTKIAEYGNLKDFMTTSAYNTFTASIKTLCPGGRCDLNAVKIFKQLSTTYTATTSRLGKTIPVPDFWTALLVTFPTNMSLQPVMNALKTIPNVVTYSHPNYIATFFNGANDYHYSTSQKSLHSVTPFTNFHINIEEAWDVIPNGGRSTVKGGVFDTGIYWAHEDFGWNGSSNASSKVEGWDFQTNADMKSGPGEYANSAHGTRIGGVISAIRNNGVGVAGIAGGNYTMSTQNRGISLYSLRIGGGGLTPFFAPTVHYIADAIITSAISNPTLNYAYGLNFQNASWGFYPSYSAMYTDSNITLINDAVHQANRAQVAFIASRGNDSFPQNCVPALTDDDWVITVGGFGTDGTRMTPLNGNGYTSYGDLDVCAPAANTEIFSTDNWQPLNYGPFAFTSAAAPHVSGVVALLQSYMNDTTGASNYKNLAPEDCEEIIQRTATDVSPASYDQLTGYGRLNAGKALRLVEKPYRDVKHFGTNPASPYVITKSVYSLSDTIVLREPFTNYASTPVTFPRARYVVKTYQINAIVNHNLPSTDTIKGYWARPSSSAVLELFNANKKLLPRERVIINSLNNSSASLKGYIYQVKDTLGTPLGWWPCDTTFACALLSSPFEYSILTRNSTPLPTSADELGGFINKIDLFPNPANEKHNLVIQTNEIKNLTVDLYDLMGRHVKTAYSGKTINGDTHITCDISALTNSMYFYIIRLNDETICKKFIKN